MGETRKAFSTLDRIRYTEICNGDQRIKTASGQDPVSEICFNCVKTSRF